MSGEGSAYEKAKRHYRNRISEYGFDDEVQLRITALAIAPSACVYWVERSPSIPLKSALLGLF